MSRHFVSPDELQVSAAGLSDADGGPISAAVVIRFDTVSAFQRIMRARTSGGAEVWAVAVDSGGLFFATTAGFRTCVSGLSANTWYLYVVEKDGGSAIIRDHLCNMATNAWTHGNRDSALGDGTGPVDNILFSDSGARLQAYVGAAAVRKTISGSDSAVEALRPGLAAWQSAAYAAIWRFNDTPVNDLIGDSDQTAISGTTVDTSEEFEPPNFSYSLGGAPVQAGAMAMFL